MLMDKILRRRRDLLTSGETNVILFYISDQQIYRQWEADGVIAYKHQGIPSIKEFEELVKIYGSNSGTVVIFDDVQGEIKSNIGFFNRLFLVLTHHMQLATFLILHNIFANGLRDLSINSHKIIITYNPRDSLGISILGRQSFPGSRGYIPAVYKYIGSKPYGYLVLNFHPECNKLIQGTHLKSY